MTAVLDLLVRRNPLVGHGPRAHRTGISFDSPAPARRRPADVDAPRIHLGPDRRFR